MELHNHGLDRTQVRTITRDIEKDWKLAARTPGDSGVIILGDFNFSAKGDTRFHHLDPEFKIPVPASDKSHKIAVWKTLDRMTEIAQADPTHFCKGNGLLSRLDRIYVSTPPWALLQMQVTCVSQDPYRLFQEGLSDHAAVTAVFATRSALPGHHRPIPRSVTRDARFSKKVKQWAVAMLVDRLPPIEAWTAMKSIIRAIATEVRASQDAGAKLKDPSIGRLASMIAKAVWRQDLRAWLRMSDQFPVSHGLAQVVDGRIGIKDNMQFAEILRKYHLKILDDADRHDASIGPYPGA